MDNLIIKNRFEIYEMVNNVANRILVNTISKGKCYTLYIDYNPHTNKLFAGLPINVIVKEFYSVTFYDNMPFDYNLNRLFKKMGINKHK